MGVDWSNLTQDRKVTGCYEEGDGWTSVYNNAWEIVWLAEEVYVSQERVCCTDFASYDNLRPYVTS
jgi:hypothetical protein